MRRLEPISRLLDKKTRSRLARPIQASVILDKFKKICKENLGEEVNKGKYLVSYKNKIIKVRCDNSIIAQEIKLKEKALLDKLNKEFNRKIAEKLAFC